MDVKGYRSVLNAYPEKEKHIMAKKIYAGNLPYSVDEDSLRELFAKIGEVQSVRLIKDNATGRSKGFGFVEMASDEDAEKAIASLNNTMLMDRTIAVSEARPQTERDRTSNRRGGGKPGRGKSFGKDRGRGTDRWR